MTTAIARIARAVLPAKVRRFILACIWAPRLRRSYFGVRVDAVFPTLVATGEFSNFTYDLTARSLRYLGETISAVTGRPVTEIDSYIAEALNDGALNDHLHLVMHQHGRPSRPELQSPFGRRLGWYAIARAIKPSIIVETGVDRGHGAVLLCAALLRNTAEGHTGRYFGTDIDPTAGILLSGKYQTVGEILYGDSVASLEAIQGPVDLFINDSDHSAEYEALEYRTVAPKLSGTAFVLGDNAHVTDKLAIFSRQMGRPFLMFREEPSDHWYPGGGIGISFPAAPVKPI